VTAMMMTTRGGDAIAATDHIGAICIAGPNRRPRQVKSQATQ
jgi:hypothetical protein